MRHYNGLNGAITYCLFKNEYTCSMKWLITLLVCCYFLPGQSQILVSQSKIEKWIKIQLDCQEDLPDPVAFAQRMERNHNITTEKAAQLSVPDPKTLTTADQKLYAIIKQGYQEELDAKISKYAASYGLSIHDYYELQQIYDNDPSFREKVTLLTVVIKEERAQYAR